MIVYLQTLLPSTAILAYFIAPIVYLLFLPIVNWARDEYGIKTRTMILLGQCIMAFGALSICGDVLWLGKKYMIALTGLGCACFGLSQCVVQTSVMREINKAVENSETGKKNTKQECSNYVNDLNVILIAIG